MRTTPTSSYSGEFDYQTWRDLLLAFVVHHTQYRAVERSPPPLPPTPHPLTPLSPSFSLSDHGFGDGVSSNTVLNDFLSAAFREDSNTSGAGQLASVPIRSLAVRPPPLVALGQDAEMAIDEFQKVCSPPLACLCACLSDSPVMCRPLKVFPVIDAHYRCTPNFRKWLACHFRALRRGPSLQRYQTWRQGSAEMGKVFFGLTQISPCPLETGIRCVTICGAGPQP